MYRRHVSGEVILRQADCSTPTRGCGEARLLFARVCRRFLWQSLDKQTIVKMKKNRQAFILHLTNQLDERYQGGGRVAHTGRGALRS